MHTLHCVRNTDQGWCDPCVIKLQKWIPFFQIRHFYTESRKTFHFAFESLISSTLSLHSTLFHNTLFPIRTYVTSQTMSVLFLSGVFGGDDDATMAAIHADGGAAGRIYMNLDCRWWRNGWKRISFPLGFLSFLSSRNLRPRAARSEFDIPTASLRREWDGTRMKKISKEKGSHHRKYCSRTLYNPRKYFKSTAKLCV